MASFYAELEVDGHTYPVRWCRFAFEQAINERGRARGKVRHGQLHLRLDVPESDQLLAWAAAPRKPLAGHVTFFETNRLTARETVAFAAGECVGYEETFASGDGGDGAYVCLLTIAAGKLELTPGGPARAFVPAAARDYGAPLISPYSPTSVSVEPSVTQPKKKLVAGTAEHKQDRWERYQKRANSQWDYARWSQQYDTNMNNCSVGLSREREYCQAWAGESKTLKTAFTLRQIDIYRAEDDYCGQLKTGKVSLTAQAEIDLQKDADLVNNLYQVEYILEKGASKNFLTALNRIGATYKIGPQIP
ncbi:type VI secretion system tube protein TssD [Hymenobacter ruricola]|uniref:Uncharacterized protein n=1 Tax=Hymenobacter ruricola TaxID=2791023 RepID=A0ABS0HZB8_9BACT|nr:type VI secretion system tube protein TssD [Hymenobacter ruricola]MBF9219808.1 hypothetical protein [Hymenobacter ruricola]